MHRLARSVTDAAVTSHALQVDSQLDDDRQHFTIYLQLMWSYHGFLPPVRQSAGMRRQVQVNSLLLHS